MSGRTQERPTVLIVALAVGVAAMAAGRIWPKVLSKLEARPADAGIPVAALFEAELQSRGLSYFAIDAGLYQVTLAPEDGDDAGWVITANIENLTRDVLRDHDPGAIRNFANHIRPPTPAASWPTARSQLRLEVGPNDYEFGDTIHGPLTPQVEAVLVTTDEKEAGIRWVRERDLATWNQNEPEATRIARQNLDKVLETTPIAMLDGGSFAYAFFDSASPFKASLLLAPSLRAAVEPKLGWPVLAVAPCRDFVYLFRSADEAQLARFDDTVRREYETSGHPVTTEAWRISDAGIQAISTFGVPRSPHPTKR